MIRFLLLSILLTIVLRAVSVLWAGIIRGLQGHGAAPHGGRSQVPQGVQMVRDPVCGTFVVRDRALTLPGTGGQALYFCSPECRDRYRGGSSSASPARSRTA
jgi:YHS domain-containing protein